MSVGDVKATLREGNKAAEQGMDTLRRAAADAADAYQLAQATIDDSRDEDAVAGLKLLSEVAGEVKRAVARCEAATKLTDEYMKHLG